MGDGTLYYSQPNDWLFNQDITDLVLDDNTMRFSSVGMVFEGAAEDGLVTGTVTREGNVGSFTLYPVTEVDGSSFEAYIGNYQLPNRTLLVSFQEALGMRHLFYSEGNNFVRLYPVTEDVFSRFWARRSPSLKRRAPSQAQAQ